MIRFRKVASPHLLSLFPFSKRAGLKSGRDADVDYGTWITEALTQFPSPPQWIPCGQCVGCHNAVNCGQCANCKHRKLSPDSRKRVCRKRKCVCPIRKVGRWTFTRHVWRLEASKDVLFLFYT